VAYTEEQIAFIRDNQGKMGAELIGRSIGLTKRQVRHIRDQLGLSRQSAGRPARLWTAERKERAYQLYIVEGQPAAKVAEQLGVKALNVRVIAHASGWNRDPKHEVNNRNARRAPPKPTKQQQRVIAELTQSRLIGASDAELIADFIARRGVTACEPGWACGLTQLETRLGAANPARQTIWEKRQENAARRRNAA